MGNWAVRNPLIQEPGSNSRRKKYKRINSVILAADVLEYVREHGPCSGVSAARALEVGQVTAMQYLETLADCGLLRRIGEHYEIGLKCASIWASFRAREESRRSEAESNLAIIGG